MTTTSRSPPPGSSRGCNELFTAAIEAQRSGALEEARAKCRELVEASPQHARGWALRCLVELQLDSGSLDDANDWGERAYELRPDLAVTRHALAQSLTRLDTRNRPRSCTKLLERAAELCPRDARAQFRLGRAARQLRKPETAKRAFRAALAADPAHDRARFWLATLDDSVRVSAAPSAHVKALYEDYAPRYDDHLVHKLRSRAPDLVADALRDHASSDAAGRGLDAGCGTGLSGAALALALPSMSWMGVDLSPAMCDIASRRGCYDEVLAGDMLAALEARPKQFDCLASCDALVYFGDLDVFFRAAGVAARPQAALALSLEDCDDTNTWSLGPTGRFAHARSYVVETAVRRGWSCVHERSAVLRTQAGLPVHGRLYVFHRRRDASTSSSPSSSSASA